MRARCSGRSRFNDSVRRVPVQAPARTSTRPVRTAARPAAAAVAVRRRTGRPGAPATWCRGRYSRPFSIRCRPRRSSLRRVLLVCTSDSPRPSAICCCVSGNGTPPFPASVCNAAARLNSRTSSDATRSSAVRRPTDNKVSSTSDSSCAVSQVMLKPIEGCCRCSSHKASRLNTQKTESLSALTPWVAASPIFCCTPIKSPASKKFRICRRPSRRVLKRNAQPCSNV